MDRNKHRGLKGNALLAFVTTLLGCAVIVVTLLCYFKIPLVKSEKLAASAASSHKSSSAAADIDVSGINKSSSTVTSSAKNDGTAVDLTNALFIGDSLTSGLSIYGDIQGDKIIFTNGLSISSVLNKKITTSGVSETIFETAASKKPKSIYIMLGANDIAMGISAEKYAKLYSDVIDKLKSASSDTKIYVESILPVTLKYSSKGTGITNEKIERYNAALKTLCTQKDIVFCDVASVLKDSDGTLLSNLSSDGFHLNKTGYGKWVSYLKGN